MDVDYNLYRIFLHLYEEKSISKTASKLYVSQPAISYSLKELETQLGYTLFRRNSKGIEPTNEAHELYKDISLAFNILDGALDKLNNLEKLETGKIKIGISPNLESFYLNSILKEFSKKYPNIVFEIISKSQEVMEEALYRNQIDFIIDVSSANYDSKLSKNKLDTISYCFVGNKGFDYRIERIEDLKNYPVVLPEESTNSRNKLNDYLDKNNCFLSPVLEVTHEEVIKSFVKDNFGIGYLLKNSIIEDADLKVIEFDNLPKEDVYIYYINDLLSKASKEFINDLIN